MSDMSELPRYQTVDRGVATSDGYCYACPDPVRKGDTWRRERVGNDVPHRFRLVHDVCPSTPSNTDLAPTLDGQDSAVAGHLLRGDTDGPSATAHIAALILGAPVVLLMGFIMASALAYGHPMGSLAFLLGASSGTGCYLAVTGMRTRPRRHRGAAMALTIVPAIVVGFFVVLLAMFAAAMGNLN